MEVILHVFLMAVFIFEHLKISLLGDFLLSIVKDSHVSIRDKESSAYMEGWHVFKITFVLLCHQRPVYNPTFEICFSAKTSGQIKDANVI